MKARPFGAWSVSLLGLILATLTALSSSPARAAAAAEDAKSGRADDQAAPHILYTDIESGPNSGGENDKGTYLSIFGTHFGSTGLGSDLKVYLNGVEVDNYRYLGPSRGRPDIEQITVQIGAVGNPKPGSPLPIEVRRHGLASNSDHNFMVNPGRILFVDNVKGDDNRAVDGDPDRPFRHVQSEGRNASAYAEVQAGDIVVLRGTGTPWTDAGVDGYFVRFRKSGSPPTGAPGTGPITLMGYPTEDVFIDMPHESIYNGAISGVNGDNFPGAGQWISIVDLRVEGGGDDGVINLEIHGNHWRVVNNELTAATAQASARAAGIHGNGVASYFYGNHIHDIQGSLQRLENHGIYIDGQGSYQIGYNLIENVQGGNGFQVFVNGGNGSLVADNITLDHNLIHDVAKHAINIADNARANIFVFENVVYNTRLAGIRFNTTLLQNCRIYNNTFYNTNTSGNPNYGAVTNDWSIPNGSLEIVNNIFWTAPGTLYMGGTVGFTAPMGFVSHNLWYGGRGSLSLDQKPVEANPMFVQAGSDFHLKSGSAAIGAGSSKVLGLVLTDFAGLPRPMRGTIDIGAVAPETSRPHP